MRPGIWELQVARHLKFSNQGHMDQSDLSFAGFDWSIDLAGLTSTVKQLAIYLLLPALCWVTLAINHTNHVQ